MSFRKRRRPTPYYKIPPPFSPITGDHAELYQDGTHPFCAMFQVAAEDTYDDYVICRGFDPRILRFIDYALGDPSKPGISVAKPFGKREAGKYEIAEVYPALLPTQGNTKITDFKHGPFVPPSPTAVKWRVGQNPGVVTGGTTGGQPESLTDEIGILYDHNGKVVNWLLIDSNTVASCERIYFEVLEANTGTSDEPCAEAGETDDFTSIVQLTVKVLGRICTGASVQLGDTAYVYDDAVCLTGDESLLALVGRKGWATMMVTGTSELTAKCCHWHLDGLCCP